MMAQAATLPGGILGSSSELQRTVMAMANGDPVQRFANGNQVRAGRKLTLSDLYRTPLATSEDESIYGGDPAELPTLRADVMREGVGSFLGNIPRQAAEFIASKPRFRPEQFAGLFGTSSGGETSTPLPRLQDMNLTPSTLAAKQARTAIENLPIEERDSESPVLVENVDPFARNLFPPVRRLAESGREDEDTFETETKPKQVRQSKKEERDPERERIALADEQEEFDAADEQFALQERLKRRGEASSIVKEVGIEPEAAFLLGREVRDKLAGDDRFGGYGFNPEPKEGGDRRTETNDVIQSLIGPDKNLSDDEVNDILIEATGNKPKKDMTLDERIKNNKQLFEKYFGRDLEGEKTVDAYNLAFLGFAIASGKSSNAFTNISDGLLKATKRFSETAEGRRKRKEGITKLAVTEALKSQDAEKEFARQLSRDKQRLLGQYKIEGLRQSEGNKRALAQIIAKRADLDTEIASLEKRARERNISAETRDRLNREVQKQRNIRGYLTKSYNTALEITRMQGFETSDDDFMPKVLENLNKINQASKKTGSDMLTPNAQANYFGDTTKRASAIRALKKKFRTGGKPEDFVTVGDQKKVREPTISEINDYMREIIQLPKEALRLSNQSNTGTGKPIKVDATGKEIG
jgi:hypothetical protein